MRILFFSNVYPGPVNPRGGMFNASLLKAMSDRHSVRVVAPVSWLDLLRRGVGNHPAPRDESGLVLGGTTYPCFWYPPKLGRRWYDHWMWLSARKTLLSAARSSRPQAVLSYWAHPDGAVAVKLARRLGIPSIVMTGGSDMLVLTKNRARRAAIRRVITGADAIVAVSQDIAARVVEEGASPERVHVVYRGVDREVFYPDSPADARQRLGLNPEGQLAVAVGRLVPVKGYRVLIEACRRLHAESPRFACYVLGEGSLRRELEQQIHSTGLRGIVRLPGSQNQHNLADWYRAADFTVLPSLSEGVPNVLLETLACGSRFVASRVGGVPEIADNRYDRLVPAGDAAALAAAMKAAFTGSRLMTGEPLTEKPAAGEMENCIGPRSFIPFSWHDSAEAVANIIAGLIHREQPDGTAEREVEPGNFSRPQRHSPEEATEMATALSQGATL